MFKNHLLKFFGSLLFALTSILAILTFIYFCYIIVKNFNDLNEATADIDNLLTAIATIFTAMTAVAFFLYNLRLKRIDRAHKLCEEFEGADYKLARRLCRALKETHESGKMTPDFFQKLLNNDIEDEEVKQFCNANNILQNECRYFKESLIFTFNYWERVYIEIVRGHSNEWYLREQLFEIFIFQYDRFSFWLDEYVQKNSPSQYRRLKYFYEYAQKAINKSNFSQKLKKWWCAI